MKRILMLLFLMVSSLALVACGDDKVTLEWETMPKSVYEIGYSEATFQKEVKVKINDIVYTLEGAVELGATVTGFDTLTAGQKTVTVKYESLTITWSFVVEPVIEDEFEPSTDWYTANTSATTFTLMTEEDLFGLAELVNEGTANFEGKTVKLGKDMDLSDKVWTPIGQGTRKEEPVVIPDEAVTQAMKDKAKIAFDSTKDYKEGDKEYIFLSGYKFAVRTNAQDDNIEYYDNSSDVVTGGKFFKGTFDGQNHKIKGLSDVGYTPTVTRIYANSVMVLKGYVFGLFGIVEGNVTIKNVVFEDVAIIGAYYDSTNQSIVKAEIDSVGAAIGYVNKKDGNLVIEDVKVLSGSITASNAAAGIVGRFYNTGTSLFKNVENHADISVLTGGNHAGGIAGYGLGAGEKEFNNAKNYGNITVVTYKTAGGILNGAGTSNVIFIIDSSNFGTISGTFITDPAESRYGLVGQSGNNSNVENSLNFGTVK